MARRFALYVVLLLGLAPAAYAQTVAVAQLSGTVADQSGGALPGVDVSAVRLWDPKLCCSRTSEE